MLLLDRFKAFFEEEFSVSRYISSQQSSSIRGGGADTSFLQTAVTQLDELVKEQVSLHKRSLLGQARNILSLENVLGSVRAQANHLHASVSQLHQHIKEPLIQLSQRQRQLEKMQRTSQLLRQVQRCLYLIARVRAQLASGNELAQAAAALAELHLLYSAKGELDISGIQVVDRELPFVQSARSLLEAKAKALVDHLGLQQPVKQAIVPTTSAIDPTLTLAPIPSLHTSLLVLYNLGVLKKTVLATLDRWMHERDGVIKTAIQLPPAYVSGDTKSKQQLNAAANYLWGSIDKLLRDGSPMSLHVTRIIKLGRALRKLALARAPLAQDSHPATEPVQPDDSSDDLHSVSVHVSKLSERVWVDLTKALSDAVDRASRGPIGELLEDILGTLLYPKMLHAFHDFAERMETQFQIQLPHPLPHGIGYVAKLEATYLKSLANKFFSVTNAIFSTGGDPSSSSATGEATAAASSSTSSSPGMSMASAFVNALGASSPQANGSSQDNSSTSVGSSAWLASAAGFPLVSALFAIPASNTAPTSAPTITSVSQLPAFGELLPGAYPHLFELMELIRVQLITKLSYRVTSHCYLLPRAVRVVGKAIKLFQIKSEEMIATDPDAYSLPDLTGATLSTPPVRHGSAATGSSTHSLTASQRRNVRVFNSVTLLALALTRLVKDPLSATLTAMERQGRTSSVLSLGGSRSSSSSSSSSSATSSNSLPNHHREANQASLRNALDALLTTNTEPLDKLTDQIIDPLFLRFNKMVERTLLTIHSAQYEWSHMTLPNGGAVRALTPVINAHGEPSIENSSKYVRVLSRQVNLFIVHLLRAFSPIATRVEERSRQAAAKAVRLFVRCVVLLPPPLSEDSKLRLAADMAQLEYALGPLCRLSETTIGDSYKELRSLRPLLFMETEKIVDSREASSLPASVLIHHIISRGPLKDGPVQQPYVMKGWTLKQYLDWMEHVSDENALTFVRTALDKVWTTAESEVSLEAAAFNRIFQAAVNSMANARAIKVTPPGK
jgi:hypothetical protein